MPKSKESNYGDFAAPNRLDIRICSTCFNANPFMVAGKCLRRLARKQRFFAEIHMAPVHAMSQNQTWR